MAVNPPLPRLRAWAAIDIGALERNLRALQAAFPPHLRWVSVVKADAYGHGLAAIGSRLMRSGAHLFAVANLGEAAALREVGTGWPVLLLSPLLPEEATTALELEVIPTVSSAVEVDALAAAARSLGRRAPLHLKVDTGMGRAGVWHPQAGALLAHILDTPEVLLQGIFTHFSSADSNAAETRRQRELFLNLLRDLRLRASDHLLIHADNSAGLSSFPQNGPLNGVRLGLLQLGVRPAPDSLLGQVSVEPVLSLHARVGLVKHLPAGTSISYGQTHVLTEDTRIAVVTAGYADGIPTALSNCGSVLLRGRRCPILGRVTMDQTVVNAQAVPDVTPGDTATFIGRQGQEHLSVEAFAQASGRIPYEAFCGITRRVTRVYTTDSAS